ncbi:MAG TPA: Hpt domain-containing protein [Paracoccaceae bacterium]|nr:Hpt domain-containing protein [Paracoccaceae bacterium]
MHEITGGDEELLAQLMVDLKASLSTSVELLRAASDQDWGACAHRLKGGALAMGAERIAALAASAEEDAPPSAGRRAQVMRDVDAAFADIFAGT